MLEWISLRGCGITIAEEVQNLTRQGSEQPDVMVRFAFLGAGGRTRKPPEIHLSLNYSMILNYDGI